MPRKYGKILVTGGAGFIGQHLLRALLADGVLARDITVFLWNDESLPDEFKGMQRVHGDIAHGDALFVALEGISTIFHLAARTDFDGTSLDDYWNTNVLGTQRLLDGAREAGAERVIFFSSMAVHGIPAEVGPIENWPEWYAPQKPEFTNPYGHSKWIGENRVRQANREWGLEFAILRPTSVYGPGENGPTLALINAVDAGMFFRVGSGENFMEYVFVTDVVQAALLAAKSEKTQICTLISGRPVQLRTLLRHIYTSLDKPFPRWWVPGWIVLILSMPLGFLRAFGFTVPLYPQRVRTLLSTYVFDTSKAKQEIGYFSQVGIKNGIAQTVEWNHWKLSESEVSAPLDE